MESNPLYEVDAGRATITINEPEKMNPLSVSTMAGLTAATREAVADNSVRVIVYTGAGERAFSAGGDLAGSFADEAIGLHGQRAAFADLFREMWRGGKPTVARVNGHALAGGFGLAVACDITVCVDDAKLGTTEARVGLWPSMISAILARSMPRKAALEMMLTGRMINPEEANRLGAVSRVVPRSELDTAVDEVVEAIMATSPTVTMLGRDSFFGMLAADLDTALDRLQLALTEIMLSEDSAEGVNAFLEKRDPTWTE